MFEVVRMAPVITWRTPATRARQWDLTVVAPEPAPPDASLETLGEAALVEACRAGTPGAFDLVVERHQRTVYRLCFRFTGSHEDASDLTQDVFLRAYRGLHRFRGQSSLGTWLHRIGINVCLNRVAAKTPAVEPLDARQHVDTRQPSPSEQVLARERADHLRAAVAALPPKQRAALVLRIYQDMSYAEIARALDSSVGAVKANVFHALQNLKRALKGPS